MKRRIVVLMGLDGSGKSTQAALLAQWLKDRGVKAAVVWMRGDSYVTLPVLKVAKTLLGAPRAEKRGQPETEGAERQYAESKRSVFRNPLARALWRALVLFDFYITYRLAFGKLPGDVAVVILDRYIYDSLIDIDSGFGSKGAEVKRLLNSSWTRLFPKPDRVILLQIPPAEAMRRKSDIPSMAYLVERSDLYKLVAAEVRAAVVDATKPIDRVRVVLVETLKDFLASSGPSRPPSPRPPTSPRPSPPPRRSSPRRPASRRPSSPPRPPSPHRPSPPRPSAGGPQPRPDRPSPEGKPQGERRSSRRRWRRRRRPPRHFPAREGQPGRPNGSGPAAAGNQGGPR
jgi:thymidylate kinase